MAGLVPAIRVSLCACDKGEHPPENDFAERKWRMT
jgi:hypothetical protein